VTVRRHSTPWAGSVTNKVDWTKTSSEHDGTAGKITKVAGSGNFRSSLAVRVISDGKPLQPIRIMGDHLAALVTEALETQTAVPGIPYHQTPMARPSVNGPVRAACRR